MKRSGGYDGIVPHTIFCWVQLYNSNAFGTAPTRHLYKVCMKQKYAYRWFGYEIFNMVSHAWFSRNLHVTCLIHESPYNQNGISKHITAKGALIIGVACDCHYRIRIPFVVDRYLLVYFYLHNFMLQSNCRAGNSHLSRFIS